MIITMTKCRSEMPPPPCAQTKITLNCWLEKTHAIATRFVTKTFRLNLIQRRNTMLVEMLHQKFPRLRKKIRSKYLFLFRRNGIPLKWPRNMKSPHLFTRGRGVLPHPLWGVLPWERKNLRHFWNYCWDALNRLQFVLKTYVHFLKLRVEIR